MNLTRIISRTVPTILLLLLCRAAHAQVNSGSNGSDGAFNPTTNTVINMADHPTGIYHYTSVNISNGVTVTFIPNANNTPVIWLVQSNCVINGTVDASGQQGQNDSSGQGGPGGYRGGSAGSTATSGQGPGGGAGLVGEPAAFGTLPTGGGTYSSSIYGNQFLVPLIGGSGGGGLSYCSQGGGGGGGGGALLIAASQSIELNGGISSRGGYGGFYNCGPYGYGGGGSGGAVRFVAQKLRGSGNIDVNGGIGPGCCSIRAGQGRVRFDTFENNFGGTLNGVFTQGFQPIIIPTAGQGVQLAITSVGGVPVSASPTGGIGTPDAVLSAQQSNPISIVVHCSNIPLNTQITVSVKPANGAAVSATGYNNTGTLSSSTATISINMPRGGGLIYATAATGN